MRFIKRAVGGGTVDVKNTVHQTVCLILNAEETRGSHGMRIEHSQVAAVTLTILTGLACAHEQAKRVVVMTVRVLAKAGAW